MKKIVIASLLTAILVQSKAQEVPGYDGHRLSIEYNLNIHPFLGNISTAIFDNVGTNPANPNSGSAPASSDFNIGLTHAISLDWAISRFECFGGSFQFFSFSQGDQPNQSPYYSGTGTIFSLYVKHFARRAGAIAPLGKYIKPELCLMLYSGTNYTLDANGKSVPNDFTSDAHLGATFSIGRTFIFKRIIIDRGFRFSLLNMGSFLDLGYANINANPDPAKSQIQSMQMINFYVGIGFLP